MIIRHPVEPSPGKHIHFDVVAASAPWRPVADLAVARAGRRRRSRVGVVEGVAFGLLTVDIEAGDSILQCKVVKPEKTRKKHHDDVNINIDMT